MKKYYLVICFLLATVVLISSCGTQTTNTALTNTEQKTEPTQANTEEKPKTETVGPAETKTEEQETLEESTKEAIAEEQSSKQAEITAKEEIKRQEFTFNPASIVNTDNGVSMSIDDIKYEIRGADYAKVTSITFSVLNKGNTAIIPHLYIFLYDNNDESDDKHRAKAEIKYDYTNFPSLDIGQHITKKADINIQTNDINLTKTLKLTLVEEFSYPEKAYVSVEKPLNLK